MKFVVFVAVVAGIAHAGYAPPPPPKCDLKCPMQCLKKAATTTTSTKETSVKTICDVITSNEKTVIECFKQCSKGSETSGGVISFKEVKDMFCEFPKPKPKPY